MTCGGLSDKYEIVGKVANCEVLDSLRKKHEMSSRKSRNRPRTLTCRAPVTNLPRAYPRIVVNVWWCMLSTARGWRGSFGFAPWPVHTKGSVNTRLRLLHHFIAILSSFTSSYLAATSVLRPVFRQQRCTTRHCDRVARSVRLQDKTSLYQDDGERYRAVQLGNEAYNRRGMKVSRVQKGELAK